MREGYNVTACAGISAVEERSARKDDASENRQNISVAPRQQSEPDQRTIAIHKDRETLISENNSNRQEPRWTSWNEEKHDENLSSGHSWGTKGNCVPLGNRRLLKIDNQDAIDNYFKVLVQVCDVDQEIRSKQRIIARETANIEQLKQTYPVLEAQAAGLRPPREDLDNAWAKQAYDISDPRSVLLANTYLVQKDLDLMQELRAKINSHKVGAETADGLCYLLRDTERMISRMQEVSKNAILDEGFRKAVQLEIQQLSGHLPELSHVHKPGSKELHKAHVFRPKRNLGIEESICNEEHGGTYPSKHQRIDVPVQCSGKGVAVTSSENENDDDCIILGVVQLKPLPSISSGRFEDDELRAAFS